MSHQPQWSAPNDDDYGHLFSDEDTTFYKEVDNIDSRASSPIKLTSPLHNASDERTLRSVCRPTQHSSFPFPEPSASAPPVTPSRPRHNGTTSTSAKRFSAMERVFSGLDLQYVPMSPPTPLFINPSSKPVRLAIRESSSDDDSDEERGEVSKILTDTEESPLSDAPSMTWTSSQGSMVSGMSGPFTPASSYNSSSGKKRDSDAGHASTGSPSKYRKVGTDYHTAYHAQGAYPTPSKNQPAVVDDVFSAPRVVPEGTEIRPNPPPSPPIEPLEAALDKFLSGPIGVDLEIGFITHNKDIQALLDEEQISWGVQYELARGVTTGQWTWDAVKSKIGALRGPSVKTAYRVRSLMLNVPQKGSDLTLWEELDREDQAITENRERGLGLMGEWQGDPDWYGGQIQQLARLVKSEKTYKINLEPMEKRRSHRFARYLSSRRIIQLRIPDELVMKELPDVWAYLSKKFVLCGRIFVPLHAKDGSVYMIETNEDYERKPGSWCGDEHRRSFADVVNWHNPLDLNKNQPISKWSTRFALGLSNSVPALIFDEGNILIIDDIYASDVVKGQKAPAEKIMTDGCGFINRAAAINIRRKLNLAYRPTAVQARIKGAKGLFIIHPTDTDPEPKIWIRKSQDKMMYLYPLDRGHRILDLLTISRYSPPITLSRQSILNLSHNGIPDETLIELLTKGLMDEVKPLMDWSSPQAMISLWYAINRIGGVTGSRTQRQVAGKSRAIGLQGREWGHADVGMGDDNADTQDLEVATRVCSGRNDNSGSPLAMHENAVELVQAGFRPDKLKYLRDKIRYIINQTITTTVEKYQIPLQLTTKALIVPDPLGVLEEGEIFYRSSQEILNPETQTLFNVVTGDVLLGRYPLRLPSDIQKVKAVDNPALYDWPDVVIAPTKGTCSLASLLAGGDHDGDEVFLILLPLIVQLFRSKKLTEMPKTLIKDNFEGQVESVTAFSERASAMSTGAAQKAFQEICLLGLNDSKVGLYSNFHDYAVWKHGLEDPRTVRMAYMFNTLLDSSKTGLRLQPRVFEKDRAKFGGLIPDFDQSSKPFILHALSQAGKLTGEHLLQEYDRIGQDADRPDADLKAPYSRFSEFALNAHRERNTSDYCDELKLVRDHVSKTRQAFNEACRKSKEGSPDKKQKRRTDQKDPMLAVSQMFAEKVEGVFLIPNVEEVKASYAYHESSTFAFAVAFRELCLIKARASQGGIAPTIRAFDEAKTISTSYIRAVAQVDNDRL